MASKIPNTVCSAPWSHFAIGSHADGHIITPCCRFNVKDQQYMSPKFDPAEKVVSRQGYFENIRQRMLSGEKLPECSKCWSQEKHNNFSMRHQMLKRMDQSDIESLETTANPFELRYIEIMFTNLCNLSCRMCDVTQTSKWANLYNSAFAPHGITDEYVMSNNFLDDKGLAHTKPIPFDWTMLNSIDLSTLTCVKILGGEPMMSPEHLEFLTKLMSMSKDPSQIELIYHTNGTKRPPQKVIDYWRQMKTIELVFSIDGHGDTNEYQRIGSDWNTIVDNIKWYADLGIDFEYRIHSVLSVLNIWNFEQLCEWAQTDFKQITNFPKDIPGVFHPDEKVITIDFVQRPPYLDLSVMPDSLKQTCVNLIQQSTHMTPETVQSILDHLKSNSYNKDYWKEFWQKMTAIDNHTKQNLFDVAPQLKEHIL